MLGLKGMWCFSHCSKLCHAMPCCGLDLSFLGSLLVITCEELAIFFSLGKRGKRGWEVFSCRVLDSARFSFLDHSFFCSSHDHSLILGLYSLFDTLFTLTALGLAFTCRFILRIYTTYLPTYLSYPPPHLNQHGGGKREGEGRSFIPCLTWTRLAFLF